MMTKRKARTQEPEHTLEDLGVPPAPVVRTYTYQPREDITAYELALMMPVFVALTDASLDAAAVLEQLPDGARRHWVEVDAK